MNQDDRDLLSTLLSRPNQGGVPWVSVPLWHEWLGQGSRTERFRVFSALESQNRWRSALPFFILEVFG